MWKSTVNSFHLTGHTKAYVYRLKISWNSSNHIVQHNKQHHSKVLLSSLHLNGGTLLSMSSSTEKSPGLTESQDIASWKLVRGILRLRLAQLACTFYGLCPLWSSSNLHARERKFLTIWPPNESRRKLSSALFSFVRARVQGCTEMAFLLLALNLRLLAGPFGHPSQVCVRKFTFTNLRQLATPFG